MSSSVFRIFNPGAPKEDPVQRRRGQLRRAQQSYRDRKDRYTKSLEKELAHARTNEARLTRECDDLRSTVRNVAHLLSDYGISPPPEMHETLSLAFSQPDQGVREDTASQPHSSDYSSPEYSSSQGKAGSASGSTSVAPLDLSADGARVCDVDEIAVGMEFVLKIEEPCLGHLHGNPQKPEDPNGHALTASAHLLCASSHQTPASSNFLPPATPLSYSNAPASMLERLLSLAPDLSADGEITPIQAWNSIRCRPQFKRLDIQRLRILGEMLRQAVKCHGFGAVVQDNVFEKLVFETLILGQEC